MSTRLRIIAASALLTLALIGTFGVAAQIEMTYYLSPDATGTAVRKTIALAPAIVGTVAAGLASAGLVGYLFLTIRAQPRRWLVVAAMALTGIAVSTPFIVSGMGRPVF